jgi:hypothetical protein
MDYMKAAFEKFVINHDPSGHCTNLLAMNESQTNYLHPHVDIAWSAWKASVAAIDKYAEPYKAEVSLDLEGIAAALHAYGIKVKGKKK